jgi:hypothetical protein
VRASQATQCGPWASLRISNVPSLVVTESVMAADFTLLRGRESFSPIPAEKDSRPRFRPEKAQFQRSVKFSLPLLNPSRTIRRVERSHQLTLTCPSCGNSQNFLVKTLQMHVVHLEDSRVEVSEESRPAVLEVLCDECETALKFEEFEDALRKEVLLTLGAR